MVNHHALIPSKDNSKGRHLSIAEYLPEYGWTSSLIVASTSHPSGEQNLYGNRLSKISSENEIPTLWVKTIAYGSSSAKRLLGMFLFAVNLLRPSCTKNLKKPTVILGSTVHLLAAWAGYRLAKRYKVPFVYEIRDVWPETLIDLGKLSSKSIVSKMMAKLSLSLARKASLVFSPLPYLDIYLNENNIDASKFVWISNGADNAFEKNPITTKRNPKFTFMYLGSHGISNNLDLIIEAFDLFVGRNPKLPIQLTFVGDGPLKPNLVKKANQVASSSKIIFEDKIPQAQTLNKAMTSDCLLFVTSNLPVYRFGISANKLFLYLNSSKPMIIASKYLEDFARKSKSALHVSSEDPFELSEAMEQMYAMNTLQRNQMGASGYEYLLSNFTYRFLASKFAKALDSISG